MLNRFICYDLEKLKKEITESPFFEAKGRLLFNPERKGLKSDKACVVIEVDEGIADYYRHQISKEFGIQLIKPSWKAHISIIQGGLKSDDENLLKLSKKLDGKEVSFKYKIFPRYSGDTEFVDNGNHGSFWFLTAESNDFIEIRKKLGLTTRFNPHLTIAKTKKD